MRFRTTFTKNFNSSAFLRMTQTSINTAMSLSMFRNKVFHDTIKMIITRASNESFILRQISAANCSPLQTDLASLNSLNGLTALLQLVKSVPSINMLTILCLLNSGKTTNIYAEKILTRVWAACLSTTLQQLS